MLHDLHYAVRMLAKSPSFTFIAALTLALGIAANSTVLSWISSTLLNPIPGATHTSDIVAVMRGERSDLLFEGYDALFQAGFAILLFGH